MSESLLLDKDRTAEDQVLGAQYIDQQYMDQNTVPQFGHFLARFPLPIILCYMGLGAICFWSLEDGQKLTFVDSCYLSIVIITTVGYGDVFPMSSGGKLFAILYVFCGLSLVATSVGILANKAVETETKETKIAHTKKTGERAIARIRRRMAKPFATIIVLCSIGTIFMHFGGNVPVIDSLYWSVISLTSVGFGDVQPGDLNKNAYRVFNCLYLLAGVPVIASSLGELVSIWMDIEDERHVQQFLRNGITKKTIEDIDADNNGEVDRAEFLMYMLVHMGKCEHKDVSKVNSLFNMLDADKSGSLDLNDLSDFHASAQAEQVDTGTRPGSLVRGLETSC